MSRRPLLEPTTGSYKRIYFNLVIFNKDWESSYYIIYYVDKYTKQHQVKIPKSKT